VAEGELHGSACLLEEYELRITRRCLAQDLHLDEGASFETALEKPIVEAFRSKRGQAPQGSKRVGPAKGAETLYHLGAGDDHRGATWFDEDERVVWLCAYGFHRSGDSGDAFQLFPELIRDGSIYPTEPDYETLFLAREARFVEMAPRQALQARADAIERSGETILVELGHPSGRCLAVRFNAEVADDVVELTVAFKVDGLNAEQIYFVPACFSPETWDLAERIGGAPVALDEIAFRLLTRLPPESSS
jgi:hypothetical protein